MLEDSDTPIGNGFMTPVRENLRRTTAACHDRVDAAFSAFDLATPHGYAAFLAAQSAALIPVEQAIEAAGIDDILPDWRERTRRSALWRDLASLGRIPAPSVAVVPPDGPAAMIGMAYVLEGSRHGAAVLLRRVMARPDPTLRTATDFLRHGVRGGLWDSFVIRLETFSHGEVNLARISGGAVAAFAAFERAATDRQPEEADHVASGH